MKYYSPLLAAAAVASALVIPDEQVLSDVALQHKEKAGLPVEYPFSRLLRATFEDALNGPGDDGSQERDIFGISDPQSLEYDASTVDDANAWLAGAGIDDNDDDENNVDSNKKHKKRPHRPPHHQPPHHGPPTQTIYELIKCSKHTTKLAEYVDEDEKLVKLLNSTDATHTLFAPTDYAFSKIPKHAPKPSKKFVRDVLRYHMSPGVHSALQIFHTRTLPTLYNEASLGKDLPQRIVVRGGLGKLKLNFYSRIVASDIPATNGVIHGINSILLPPPNTLNLLNLLPTHFSTFVLGLTKTNLTTTLQPHSQPNQGRTTIAPLNSAFEKLGPRTTAFLFSSHGKKYLRALLKYHLSPNRTLYSDVLYTDDGQIEPFEPLGFTHVDLPTLLSERSLSVDVIRAGPWGGLRVNGFRRVGFADGIAADGVVHVVGRVLVPPRLVGGGGGGNGDGSGSYEGSGEVSVEDLKDRLRASGLVEDVDE